MFSAPEFWVAVSFAGFLGILMYFRIPSLIMTQLDDHSDQIRSELDNAHLLREEAQALLTECRKKRREAEQQAESILSEARQEVILQANEFSRSIEENLARQIKIAEARITRNEEQMVISCREQLGELALSTVKDALSEKLTPRTASKNIDIAIGEIQKVLNKHASH